MLEQEPRWTRRHKRRTRRWANDVRLAAPLIAIALCVAGTATAILALERVPHVSADAAGVDAGVPPVECAPPPRVDR